MSLNLPSRRLLKSAPALTSSTCSAKPTSLLPALQSLALGASTSSSPSSTRSLHTTPSRSWFWNRKTRKEDDPHAGALEKKAAGPVGDRINLQQELQSRIKGPAMFEDEVKPTRAADRDWTGHRPADGGSRREQKRSQPDQWSKWGGSLIPEHMARATDPDPRSRIRWERKMVIRQVRRGTDPFSVEPKEELLARTERKLHYASPWLPTSVKKLVHLARQVQGKTLEDAVTQMRFSKKKMAKEVKMHLQIARDVATVERGMGLGLGVDPNDGKEVKIQTKDGRFVKIDDPTKVYIAEAWVNRGKWRGKQILYCSRGRTNLAHKPQTSISFVLKEEKTRIREHQERVAKKLRQGPWVHLPDRPVTAQRPFYSW